MSKNVAVFGIYPSREEVSHAFDALQSAGFRNTDISALFPENLGTKDFGLKRSSKAPEGASVGMIAGIVLGGALGWLAGIGALAMPGMSPLIAAGPIVAALAGVGAGAVVGAIIGALAGLGIPEYEAKRYVGRLKRGGILLSVHCDDGAWTKLARRVLKSTGADDVAASSEATADFAISDRSRPRYSAGS